MNEHQFRRLISELLDIGTISQIQADPLRYKVQLDDERETDWCRQGVTRAGETRDWDPLSAGEQVLIATPLGGTPIILCSINRDQFPQPETSLNQFFREFKDGTWIRYDDETHELSFHCKGRVTGRADGNFYLTGDVHVTGKITSTGDQIAGGVSTRHHEHDGVASGPTTTGEPVK